MLHYNFFFYRGGNQSENNSDILDWLKYCDAVAFFAVRDTKKKVSLFVAVKTYKSFFVKKNSEAWQSCCLFFPLCLYFCFFPPCSLFSISPRYCLTFLLQSYQLPLPVCKEYDKCTNKQKRSKISKVNLSLSCLGHSLKNFC